MNMADVPTVAVRVRPLNTQERARGITAPCAKVDASGSQVRLMRSGSALGSLRFSFDHVYDGGSTQHAIFEEIGRPLVQRAFRGQTCVLLAHGATGTGKTHALTGSTLNPGAGETDSKCHGPDEWSWPYRS
jgi:hypothetical protein